MKKLALAANVLFVLGVVYALAINGILSVWIDQSGFGFSFGYYQSYEGE
jgi:hypothetical protein